jgi:hypothetical protein
MATEDVAGAATAVVGLASGAAFSVPSLVSNWGFFIDIFVSFFNVHKDRLCDGFRLAA